MADDDWISPAYHLDAFQALQDNPGVQGAEVGTSFADMGDGALRRISQHSMRGVSALDRMFEWDCNSPRISMYNTSRRASLQPAISYLRQTPLPGMTLAENLWELSRLAVGDFLRDPTGHGTYMHYPMVCSGLPDRKQRVFDALCRGKGLQYPFIHFINLSTAVQCGIFLLGRLSPIANPADRMEAAQCVFGHVFESTVAPEMADSANFAAVFNLLSGCPAVQAGFTRHCAPSASKPAFDRGLLEWFIALVAVFQTPAGPNELPLADKFRRFVFDDGLLTDELLPAQALTPAKHTPPAPEQPKAALGHQLLRLFGRN